MRITKLVWGVKGLSVFCVKVLKCITKFWNKCCTNVILIKFWLCFSFVLISCFTFFMHLWTILFSVMDSNRQEVYNRTAQKVGVQKTYGSGFPPNNCHCCFFTNSVKMFPMVHLWDNMVTMILESNMGLLKVTLTSGTVLWANISITQQDFFSSLK